jgi:uncharacterized Zn finger protein
MIIFTPDDQVGCPRCGACPEFLSETELRPGVEYLTLRCHSCGIVYDAQVPFTPAATQTIEKPDDARR